MSAHAGPAGPAEPPRVVMLRALGLGDLLVAVPALRALARAFPEHRRILVAPAWLSPLVGLLGGAVTDMTHADFRSRVGRIPARAGGADVAVNLHGAGPDSHRALLESGARSLIAHHHPDVPASGDVRWDPGAHEMGRWCDLLEAHEIPADPDGWRLDVPEAPAMPLWRGAVVLHPGASSPARRWPAARWSRVARGLAADGARVLVTGSVAERGLAREVAARADIDPRAVVAGRTGLAQLARGLAQARLLVSGDTGVAHLATAVGLPSVLLFGPTSPARWGPPPGTDERHIVLWAGRTGDPHGQRADHGLLEIAPRAVLDAVARLERSGQPATT